MTQETSITVSSELVEVSWQNGDINIICFYRLNNIDCVSFVEPIGGGQFGLAHTPEYLKEHPEVLEQFRLGMLKDGYRLVQKHKSKN